MGRRRRSRFARQDAFNASRRGCRNYAANVLGGVEGGLAWGNPSDYSFSTFKVCTGVSNIWGARFNDDGSRIYTLNATNGSMIHSSDLATAYVLDDELSAANAVGVTNTIGSSVTRGWDWFSDGTGLFAGDINSGDIRERNIGSLATAFNPTIGVNMGLEAADTDTFSVDVGWDHLNVSLHNEGTVILTTSNDAGTYSLAAKQVNLSTPNDLTGASELGEWDIGTDGMIDIQFDPSGTSGWLMYDWTVTKIAKFTCSTAWDITTASLDTGSAIDVHTGRVGTPVHFLMRPDKSGFYVVEWTASTTGGLALYTL